jgi:hypothetical protein
VPSAHPFPAPPLALQHRPAGYREPATTTLSRLIDAYPGWSFEPDERGWVATRTEEGPRHGETVRARTLLGLESKLEGLT